MARYQPYNDSRTVKTCINRPVGGSDLAVNNSLETVLYGEKENAWVFDLVKRAIPDITVGTINKAKQITPGSLYFAFYDDPVTPPDQHTPTISCQLTEDDPNVYPVFHFTPDKKFTDDKHHECLGIFYDNRKLKMKFKGSNQATGGLPYFYVEDPVFMKQGSKWIGEQTQWYGTLIEIPTSVLSFGKKRNKKVSLKSVNADIKYLRR